MAYYSLRCIWILWFVFLLFIAIKSNMTTTKTIVNNLITENIFPSKVSSLRQDVWYLVITNLCQNTYPGIQNPSINHFNWTCYSGLFVKWEWCICLNTTNCQICNMQGLRYCLCTSILDYFDQLVSPLCTDSRSHAWMVWGLTTFIGISNQITPQGQVWCGWDPQECGQASCTTQPFEILYAMVSKNINWCFNSWKLMFKQGLCYIRIPTIWYALSRRHTRWSKSLSHGHVTRLLMLKHAICYQPCHVNHVITCRNYYIMW